MLTLITVLPKLHFKDNCHVNGCMKVNTNSVLVNVTIAMMTNESKMDRENSKDLKIQEQ